MNFNIRSIVLIGIALVVAGITAFLARSLVSTPAPQTINDQQIIAQIPDSNMKILIAAANLPIGHFIKEEDLTWQSWPDDKVHESYIQKDSEITAESLYGAVVKATITAGEPVLNDRLVKPGNRGFMAAVLPAGKRAISIRINATSGNAGFVFPGDHVDILLTHEIPVKNDKRKARVSEAVLTNVRVLAINQRTDNETHTPSVGQTATLEVTPKEAEKISLINRMGELTLILRSLGAESENPVLNASDDSRTVTWDSEVSSQISTSKSGSSNMGNQSVEVFRGGGAATQVFDFNQLLNKTTETLNQAETKQKNTQGEEETVE